MAYFDAAGNQLSDADAAARQWAGHVIYDAAGAPTTLVESNTTVDAQGDTEVSLHKNG